MTETQLSTGVPSVDSLLGGLHAGDNVVWELDSGAPADLLMRRFARAAGSSGSFVLISFNRSPQSVLRTYGSTGAGGRFVLVDCFTSGKGSGDKIFWDFYQSGQAEQAGKDARIIRVAKAQDPEKVAEVLDGLEAETGGRASYVFDSLTGMLELWSEEQRALSFFTHMCPRFHDLGTVAYWLLEREAHSEQFLANLRHIAQVVVALSVANGSSRFVLRKAEGRISSVIGVAHELGVAEDAAEAPSQSREELEVAILKQVSEALGASAGELESVFEQTMDVLARELKMKRGTMVQLDKVAGDLKIVAAHGLTPEERRRGHYRIGEGVTGQVVSTGQPVVVADINKDSRFLNRTGARTQDRQRGRVSFVCVPLRMHGEVVGAISVDRDFVDDATLAKDERLLKIIASLVSQAIRINRMVMVERERLLAENMELRRDLKNKYRFGNIITASGIMQDVVATAGAVAKSSATVLVRGESGTGKELIASVLHYNSDRANGPFIKVNCSALSENLLESELFGHVRGAFTGAVADRKGRFELANGGTIFLDEVGTMNERLQVKLLRVLQEKEFERVGGATTIKVDVRVVAATNADLEALMAGGAFREDLYYRLNVIPIIIPPLRDRREAIPFLVEHFLAKYDAEYGKAVRRMSREVLEALLEYDWPGNVRELESCIERSVVLSQDGAISMNLLPVSILSKREKRGLSASGGPPEEVVGGMVRSLRDASSGELHRQVMARVERCLLQEVLGANGGVQTRSAEELGLSRNTLRRKMREYGIPFR
jgi:Nif-specific regulatory protein